MARRASSGVNTQALLIGAAVLALVLGGGYWFINRAPAGFDAPLLDVPNEIDQFSSLAGNENVITGILHDRPTYANGQVVALKTEDDEFLVIIIPSDLKTGNLNLQDKYTFTVKFNTKGVAVAQDVKQF